MIRKTVTAEIDLLDLSKALTLHEAKILIDYCQARIDYLKDTEMHARQLTDEEEDLLRNVPCLKIQAIKSIRARISCGLKEAKDICDEYMFVHGIEYKPVQPR